MRRILTELYKLKRVWSLQWLTIAYFMFVSFFIYQKIVNHGSGVFDANLSTPMDVSSLALIFFCAVNYCWSIPIGSHLAAAEFGYGTWSISLNADRRGKVIGAKIATICCLCFVMVAMLVGLGATLALVGRRTALVGFSLPIFMGQISITAVSAIYCALLGFAIAFISKSVAAGNILGLGWIILNSMFYTRLAKGRYLTFDWYQSGLIGPLFKNLNRSPDLHIVSGNAFPWFVNILILLAFFTLITLLLTLINHHRDF